jgi:hypothetical protein
VTNVLRRLLSDDRVILTFVVLAAIAVHGAAMIKGLGEQDSARILNDAFIWRDNPGYLASPEVEYRPRVLPLTLIIVRFLLRSGVEMSTLPQLMNSANVVVGAMSLIPLFLIWRRIAGREAAYIALAFASVMPAFWLANIYGYPHLIAFTLFLTSLCLFLIALDHGGRAFLIWSALSGFVLAIGVSIKVDIILGGGAFLGSLWLKRRMSVMTMATAVTILGAAVISAWGMYEIIAGSQVNSVAYAAQWEERFPLSWRSLLSFQNMAVNLGAVGLVLCATIIISMGYLLFRSQGRRLVFFILIWTLPIVLFWDLRAGNSARHLMAAVVPMALLAALPISRIKRPKFAALIAGVSVLAGNYALGAPMQSSIVASPRLVASRDLIQRFVSDRHAAADAVADVREEKVFLVGNVANAYAKFAFLAKAQSVRHVQPFTLELRYAGGRMQRFAYAYTSEPVTASRLARQKRAEGYRVVSIDYDVAALSEGGF